MNLQPYVWFEQRALDKEKRKALALEARTLATEARLLTRIRRRARDAAYARYFRRMATPNS